MKNCTPPIIAALLVSLFIGCSKHSPTATPAKWLVPKGWVAVKHPEPLQVAAFVIPDASGDAHVTVLQLTNYPYALLANVNRCRDQISLPPIDASLLNGVSRPAKTASGDLGTAFRIVGKEKSILYAAFTRGETTWFFKLMAPNALAERQRDAFEYFIDSFHLSSD